MIAFCFTFLFVPTFAVSQTPKASLLDAKVEEGNTEKSGLLAMSPEMSQYLVTDTVASFAPRCFQEHCKTPLQTGMSEHEDMKKTWDCITDPSHPGDGCVEGKTWGDLPPYFLKVMDCGRSNKCLGIDLTDAEPYQPPNPPSSFEENTEENTEENKLDSFLGSHLTENLLDEDFMKTLTPEQMKAMEAVSQEQMEKVATLKAVLESFEEMGSADNTSSPMADMETHDGFNRFYKNVLGRLKEGGELTIADPKKLEMTIAQATDVLADTLRNAGVDEVMTGENGEEVPAEKPHMMAVSVGADGHVENNHLRNEK